MEQSNTTESPCVEDQVMLLDVILLNSLITRLNIILSVEKLRGYQQGTPAAFLADFAPSDSIDGPYLDGVSITVGNPRKHVWSYAVGFSKLHNTSPYKYNCPCAKYPGANPPVYVGDHYYCESGSDVYSSVSAFFGSDPLWDGRGCPVGGDCCSTLGAPWFYRHFTKPEGGARRSENLS